MYYSDYLQLDKILNAQSPESAKQNVKADDEMLFIIIHQTYELWFKQLIYEVGLVHEMFAKESLDDRVGEVSRSVHKLDRCIEILKVLVHQIDIMETMTSLDFLDFRDMLRPASGFQSIQFKILEATLGLEFDQRFGQEYYISQLREEDVQKVKKAEEQVSLKKLIDRWLERMPYLTEKYWQGGTEVFWNEYIENYRAGLVKGEEKNIEYLEKFLFEDEMNGRSFDDKSMQNALFIMVYRDYPRLTQPWRLLQTLMEIDAQLGIWRFRHMSMVRRIIGGRVGTGGSTGAKYLQEATNSHFIFRDLSSLTTFLVPRNKLPKLPSALIKDLGDFWT